MVVGMTSRIKQIWEHPERFDPWFADILQRKPVKLASIAMANKAARIIWAVLTHNAPYEVRTGVDLGKGRNTPLSDFRPHLSPSVFTCEDDMRPSKG